MDKKEPAGVKVDDMIAEIHLKQEILDFPGVFALVRDNLELLSARLQPQGIRDDLKKSTGDRLVLSMIDSVGFGVRPLGEAMKRLERLLGFTPGTMVLSAAWGLGVIKRLDYFYRRVTVDFRNRRGHQLSFDAACETLSPAPENHILVRAAADRAAVEQMIKERPADFVVELLRSFGDMPLVRMEELCAAQGFVKSANWKSFWERAREGLRAIPLVEVPTRRAEPIHLKAVRESYGDAWFGAFRDNRDPRAILSSVRELEGTDRMQALTEEQRALLADRLAFALKGARGVDDALYARIAFCIDGLKLNPELVAKTRRRLWEGGLYLRAARELPARDVGALVKFLVAENPEETKKELFAALPKMCFTLLVETLDAFSKDADCAAAVSALLRDAHPPATLVVCVLGRYESFKKGWPDLPDFRLLLAHAIALGEGRQTGETLKMQNTVRRLFADRKWLEETMRQLSPEDREFCFERFQASTAWDPSTHHLIVVRMSKLDPALQGLLVRRETKETPERITSQRSYAERQAAYEKLVNEEIPNNTKRIEFARGYGDLSENAEYQYAKDEQRALLQKQTVMQEELNTVKATLFEAVETDLVRPGVTVKAVTTAGERLFTVLGEWDNAPEMGVISNRTKLAEAMLGKRPGDVFEITDAEGSVSEARIVEILPLSDELKVWILG